MERGCHDGLRNKTDTVKQLFVGSRGARLRSGSLGLLLGGSGHLDR